MAEYLNPPSNCDLCAKDFSDGIMYDFRVPGVGSWANGCSSCFQDFSGQLGTGRGQKYVKNKEGRFEKTDG